MLTNGEIIYRPTTPIKHDPIEACEWSIYNGLEINDIVKICQIQIIPTQNYIIPINDNNLYYLALSNPLTIWETCAENQAEANQVETSGILKMKKNCSVKTSKFTLESHNTYQMYASQILEFGSKVQVSDSILNSIVNEGKVIPEIEIKLNKSVLIEKCSQLQQSQLVEKSKYYELDLKEFKYDNQQTSIWSTIIGSCSVLGILV